MSTWRTLNGIPLLENGKGAIHDNCCCAGGCCNCPLLQEAIDLALNLEVTISGDITGVCILVLEEPTHGGQCKQWSWNRATGTCPTGLGGCDGSYILSSMMMYCPEGGTAPGHYKFAAALDNLGCNFDAPTKTPDTITCTDQGNGLDDFYAKYTFPLVPTSPNGCDGCGANDQVVFEVRII